MQTLVLCQGQDFPKLEPQDDTWIEFSTSIIKISSVNQPIWLEDENSYVVHSVKEGEYIMHLEEEDYRRHRDRAEGNMGLGKGFIIPCLYRRGVRITWGR